MLDVRYSTRFKKDFKTCVKRGYHMPALGRIIDTLKIPEALPAQNVDHRLTNNYSGYRECHVAPDWLLIYRQTSDELLLYRTGTHSDLFGK
ncbi:mRNA interferase toxin YafQ [Firmicutes bacterium ASF500]|nr:mRNA interferase toxin YafQ [Firmicutes bacterium ASF500]